MTFTHQPVLIDETLAAFEYLATKDEPIFVDGTLGLAGHSMTLAQMLNNPSARFIGIDKDNHALTVSKDRIKKAGLSDSFSLVHDDFNNFDEILQRLDIEKVDGILLDLGVSSMQLDDRSRGFSFSDLEMPLDMRMDQSRGLSASDIVNDYSEAALSQVLKDGEEWHFRKIASMIVRARKEKPIRTVGDLVAILEKALPKKHSKTHFATDTFRALRLEVNDEISRLGNTITSMVDYLKPGGRLAIISFHSIEDRIVKETFRKLANPCTCPPKLPVCSCVLKPKVIIKTKKPLIAGEAELMDNPRSRSAKLRIAEKL